MKTTLSQLKKNQLFRFNETDYNPSVYCGIKSNCYCYLDEDGEEQFTITDYPVISY